MDKAKPKGNWDHLEACAIHLNSIRKNRWLRVSSNLVKTVTFCKNN